MPPLGAQRLSDIQPCQVRNRLQALGALYRSMCAYGRCARSYGLYSARPGPAMGTIAREDRGGQMRVCVGGEGGFVRHGCVTGQGGHKIGY